MSADADLTKALRDIAKIRRAFGLSPPVALLLDFTADRLEALAEERADLRALAVRYWCGDGPTGAGHVAGIAYAVAQLPAGERSALLAAIDDTDLAQLVQRIVSSRAPSHPEGP